MLDKWRLNLLGAAIIAGVALILAIPGIAVGGFIAWAFRISLWPALATIAGLGAIGAVAIWARICQ